MKDLKVRLGVVMAAVFLFSSLAAATAGEVKDREMAQEKRIQQGVNSGELTAGETANLQAHEAKIEKDRQEAMSDGKVTRHERRKLHREEHRQSKRIHHKKHNAKTATEPTSS